MQTTVLVDKTFLIEKMADNLGMGFVTFRNSASRSYNKLPVHSRAQAVVRCLQFSPHFADNGEFERRDDFLESRDGKQFKHSIRPRT